MVAKYAQKAREFGMIQPFSNKGNPYDNVPIESFHSILKKKEVNHRRYFDFITAKLAVFELIEI